MSFSSFRPPEYLYQTKTGLFIFRMSVPLDYRPVLHKTELRYSLKTRCIRTVRQYLAAILSGINEFFNKIRLKQYHRPSIDEASLSIKNIVNSCRNPQGQPHIVKTRNILSGDTINQQSITPPSAVHEAKQIDPVSKSDVQASPFSAVIASFFKEKELSEGWRPKTKKDHQLVFRLFMEIQGDIPIESIDKVLMRKFKSTVSCLPPNMRKDRRYKSKTIPQILKLKPEKTISTHTINKYLSRISNLFTYAVSHGYLSVNPASGLKVKLKTRSDQEREAYSNEDLQMLFSTPDFTHRSFKHSYQYWTPLIGLFTGCRLEEICQFHLADIRQEAGIWIFDINDKH